MDTLKHLPFYNSTQIELYTCLESPQNRIKELLESNRFQKYLLSLQNQLPHNNFSCKYYTEDETKRLADCNTLHFSLMHMNIRSMNKNWNQFISLKSTVDHDFDVFALTEIGELNTQNHAAFLKDEYHYIEDPPQTNRCGGAGLLLKKKYDYIERKDMVIQSCDELEIENVWIEIEVGNEHIIIGAIYRHPTRSKNKVDTFSMHLENKLQIISQENKQLLLVGDLNIDGLKLNADEPTTNFFDMIMAHNVMPKITLPTRITDHSISLIDHILHKTTPKNMDNQITTGNIFSDISDHLPNFILINSQKITQNKNSRPVIRIFGDRNIQKFKNKLKEVNWKEITDKNKDNINNMMQKFYTIYNKAFNESFPYRRLSRKRSKDKKWMTTGLKVSTRHKSELYKKFLNSQTKEMEVKYKRYRNIHTSCLRKAEEHYYKELVDNQKHNVKTLWNIFGPVINPRKIKKTNKINAIKVDNARYTSNKDIANQINNYFSTIGHKLNKSFENENNYKAYMKHPNQHNFYLYPVTPNEMRAEMMKLKSDKSPGPDNMSPRMIKICLDELLEPLTVITNEIFASADYPELLKLAKVIPIYKKNDPEDPGNYRPISLLNIINKLVEKHIHKRLFKFVTKHKLLYKYQFGFQPKLSTTLALIEIVQNIQQAIEKGEYTLGIYLDLTKAFDTVDHKILLDKLEHYGIRGHALKLLKSYLSNRKQFTFTNGTKSDTSSIEYGVPQGSVLGPLLFIIYVNDIQYATKENLRLFADDSNMFISDFDPISLKNRTIKALHELIKWFKANKLVINMSKTNYNLFSAMNKNIPPVLNSLKIENTQIKRSKTAKYLGVILDEQLIWDGHIDQLRTEMIKIINSFKIIKNFVNGKNKSKLFNAYLSSKVKYGLEVFGQASAAQIKKIQTQQNRALKILYNKDFHTNKYRLHSDLKYLTVEDTHKQCLVNFVHKHINNKLPDTFRNYYTTNLESHSHNTRQTAKIHIDRRRNEQAKKMITYSGAIAWNNLPNQITSMKNYTGFKKAVKDHYIKIYQNKIPTATP